MKAASVIYTGFILLICFFGPGLSRGETTIDTLFQAAVEQVGRVSRAESIKAFEEIISKDRNYAPAYNELAKLHLLDYSVNGRQRARQIIQKAIEQDHKNPTYQLTRAKILWSQGFWQEALNQYKKVHPKNTEALDGIGMALVYEYLSMRDEVKATDRDFSGFAAKANREAEQVLLKSIQLNPVNQTPYYLLGMLYFESQRFADFQALMKNLKMHYPTDKNVLLFCGLAEYEVGEFNSAHQFYAQALEQMSSGERELMESIDLLVPQEDPDIPVVQLSHDNISQSDELLSRNNFWKSQDPLYLSEFNERKMEHFGRMAYANLRFRQFSDDMEGWQTDMGKTYIKFGKFRYRKSSSVRSVETWFYEQFKIFFTGNGADRWRFGGGFEIAGKRLSPSRKASAFDDTNAVANVFKRSPVRNVYPTRFEERSDRVFLKTEQRYVDPYLNRKYTLPYLIAAFQERDSVRVELSYMIPKDRLKENPETGKVSFWDGVFLFDKHWDEIYNYRKSVNFALPPPVPAANAAARHRNNHLLISRNLYASQGTYHFSVELLDQTSGAIGIARNEEQFLYDKETFHLSDLLVASNIQTRNAFPEHRDDLIITPNPVRTFSQSESIFIYLELYDLQRDNFGRTHYQISYTISKPEMDTVSPALFMSQKVLDTLGKTEIDISVRSQVHHTEAQDLNIERAQDSDVIRTVTANYEGNREDDFTYLQIDVNQVPEGIYQLTVLAKDKQTEQTDSKYVYFRVVE